MTVSLRLKLRLARPGNTSICQCVIIMMTAGHGTVLASSSHSNRDENSVAASDIAGSGVTIVTES